MKYILGIIFICVSFSINAQTIVNNSRLHILYKGVVNELQVLNPKVKKKNLIVACSDANIIDSLGYFFIKIPHSFSKRETHIKIKDKRKKYWLDSVPYRIKTVPKPFACLGPLRSGEYSKLVVISQSSLNAVIENFVMEGIKYNIISYRLRINNPFNFVFDERKVIGNSSEQLREALSLTSGPIEIVLDSIKYEFLGDTGYTAPLHLFINSNRKGNYLYKVKNYQNKIQVLSDIEDLKYYNHKYIYEIQGIDTFLSMERVDLDNSLNKYIRYYPYRQTPQIANQKINDTLFQIKYYDSNYNLIAEGCSKNFIYEFYQYNVIGVSRKEVENNFNFESVLQYILSTNFEPIGKWIFYNAKTQQKIMAHFVEKTYPTFNQLNVIYSDDSPPFYPTGTWQLINSKEEVIEEKKY